jgi:SAM-dependent methyltransferase
MDFDAMADAYDALEPWYEHLYAVLHPIVRRQLPPAAAGRPVRALDAGCGTGFQAAVLASLGYRTHGVDLSPKLLAVARHRLAPVRFARGNLEMLPYRTASFEAITCCGSTLSFVDSPARATAEMGRVLRPGGLLLLECEHRGSLDLAWAAVSSVTGDRLGYQMRPRDVWGLWRTQSGEPARVSYPGYGRLWLFTVGDLRALLHAAGLDVLHTWGIHMLTNLIPSTVLHRPRLGRPLAVLYRLLCRLDDGLRRLPAAPGMANSVVVLARRRPRL